MLDFRHSRYKKQIDKTSNIRSAQIEHILPSRFSPQYSPDVQESRADISNLTRLYMLSSPYMNNSSGKGNESAYDDRVPCVYYHWTKQNVAISTPIESLGYVLSKRRSARRDHWHHLVISQEKMGSTYGYKIALNGKEIVHSRNDNAEIFYSVIVYASSPMLKSQTGKMRRLDMYTKGKISQLFLLHYRSTTAHFFLVNSNHVVV